MSPDLKRCSGYLLFHARNLTASFRTVIDSFREFLKYVFTFPCAAPLLILQEIALLASGAIIHYDDNR
jgi:hypothetical protein